MSKEKLYPIQVYSDKHQSKKERAKGLVKIRYEAYEKMIPKSYLEADNLVVKDGNVKIPTEIFEVWFEKAAEEDRLREIQSMIEAEEEALDDVSDLVDLNHPFYVHIPLFWKNKEMILSNPHFYRIRTPQSFSSSRWVHLGSLLQSWDKIGRKRCDECGQLESVSCIIDAGLSVRSFDNICLSCGYRSFRTLKYAGGNLLYSYYGGLGRYKVEPTWVAEADLSELIRACKRY